MMTTMKSMAMTMKCDFDDEGDGALVSTSHRLH